MTRTSVFFFAIPVQRPQRGGQDPVAVTDGDANADGADVHPQFHSPGVDAGPADSVTGSVIAG